MLKIRVLALAGAITIKAEYVLLRYPLGRFKECKAEFLSSKKRIKDVQEKADPYKHVQTLQKG